MMKCLAASFSLLALLLALSACVPQNQYNATVTELNYYRNQAQRADSVATNQQVSTYNSTGSSDMELRQRIQQVEALTATNMSLNRSFEDLNARYNELLSQNQLMLTNSGDQITNLQQNLADRVAQVSAQEAALRQKEMELQAREQQLAQVGAAFDSQAPATYGSIASPQAYDTQAKSLTMAQQQALKNNRLQNDLSQTLLSYPRTAANVLPTENGEVLVTLSEGSLFTNGFLLSVEGRNLLQRIALVLQAYPEAKVEVIGHGDASVDAVAAFELGSDRAIAITQNLISHGVRPQRLLAASKGYYAPIASNTTAADQASNRRTELLITLP